MHTHFFVGKPEGKKQLGRSSRRWENTKLNYILNRMRGCGLDSSGLG